MRITNRIASLAYKIVLAIIGTLGLIFQSEIYTGVLEPHFIWMFTHISNIAVVVYVWGAIISALRHPDADPGDMPWAPKVKHALMLAIMVTCLVATFMLPDFGMVFTGGGFSWTLLVLHYIVPLGFIADWLLFDKKGIMTKTEPPTWVVFPLVYLVYIIIAVGCFGVVTQPDSRWPYPFLNFDANGVPMTLGICVGMLVFFIAFGYVLVLVDHLLARKANK